ncbi:MAG: hypothetical protein M1436_02925 [Acidobacteria bacterium]|nr:hypothetical protein [Acidobacteriota bacterium]
MTYLRRTSLAMLVSLVAVSCQNGSRPTIQRIRDGQALRSYRLRSMAGVRDGDSLRAQVVFVSNNSILTMDMQFRIGVPTRLEYGKYRWDQGNQSAQGTVAAKSVTFLGGQPDRPSLGGIFELQSREVGLYEVTVPTGELAPARSFTLDPGTRPPPVGERRGD